jgi:AraC-like DNA-binding protein
MLQPAAGALLAALPLTELVDQAVPLESVTALAGADLVASVRTAVGDDPHDAGRQQLAVAAVGEALAALGPVDEEGLLVNRVVEYVEEESDVVRVGQVCERFDLSERSLQRLAARRIGLSPKWLIQRRRLHEAAELLASAEPLGLAGVAAHLGYADQAHFTRDFKTVTGMTPGRYAAEPRDT